MHDETMQMPPNARALLLPYSPETLHLGVGGETMYGALVSDLMVQLYCEDGSPFRTPITRDGAGWDNQPCYLIIRGQVETGPGVFEDGVISSSPCATVAEAISQWDRYVDEGFYDPRFERMEIQFIAPTLAEVLA